MIPPAANGSRIRQGLPGFGSRQRTEPLPIFLVLSEQHELKRKAISSRPSP